MADNVIVRVPEQQFIRGEDGYSPVVTIENIDHGHSITITDREHQEEGQTFNVLDGDSAYEQAVAGGYTGTEAQFNEELASFKELSDEAKDAAPFYAEYGVTTKAEIETAINGKRQIYVHSALGMDYAPLVGTFLYLPMFGNVPQTGYRFATVEGTTQYIYDLRDEWFTSENDLAAPAQRAETAAAQALTRMNSADASAQDSEAYAIGKRNGVDVGAGDPASNNNSKYYMELAAHCMAEASSSETAAASSMRSARNYASSAQNYAGQATSSASDAATAKTAAETAQGLAESAQAAAETAQDAAEDAQAAAEAVLASIPSDYTDLSEDVSDLQSAVNEVVNIVVSPNILQEKYVVGSINSNGTDGTSQNYKRTEYQPIEPNKALYFLRGTQAYLMKIFFYDSTKTNISTTNTVFAANVTALENNGNLASPANAVYFRLMIPVAITDTISIAYSKVAYQPYGETEYKLAKSTLPFYEKNIAFMGDSIVGNFNDNTGLCSVIAEKTGATVINCAFAGTRMAYRYGNNQQYRYWDALSGVGLAMAIASGDWTAQDTAVANLDQALSYFADRLTEIRAIDWSTIDYILWEYGTNDFNTGVMVSDTSDTTNLFAYDNAYRKAIEQISTAYPNIQIIPITPLWRWWRDGDTTNYLDDSNTHTTNDYDGTPRLLTAFVAKAQEIAREYQLPCIDDYYTMGANKFTYLHFYDNTDGVHPNAEGRERIAEHIASQLDSVV